MNDSTYKRELNRIYENHEGGTKFIYGVIVSGVALMVLFGSQGYIAQHNIIALVLGLLSIPFILLGFQMLFGGVIKLWTKRKSYINKL